MIILYSCSLEELSTAEAVRIALNGSTANGYELRSLAWRCGRKRQLRKTHRMRLPANRARKASGERIFATNSAAL